MTSAGGTNPSTPESTIAGTPEPPDESIEWQSMIGGGGTDHAYSIQLTSDASYILAGYSDSTNIEGSPNNGNVDCYIVKLKADTL
jgi:hypothetical protein